MKQGYLYALVGIFLLVVVLRSILSYQSETLDYSSYFALRQIEHIQEEFLPLYDDPLSYQGRVFLFPPFFYYLMSAFAWAFGAIITAKVITSVFAASIVIIIYAIVLSLTEKKGVSLLCALFAGLTPAFFSLTLNDLSVFTFVIPLFFLSIYLLLNIRKEFVVYYLFVSLLILVMSHPIIFVFVIGQLIFILLLKLESFKIERLDYELVLFMTFLATWISFLIYKKAFYVHGLGIVWQNLPAVILAEYFKSFSYLEAISYVGFIPLLFGVIGAYHIIFRQKRRHPLLVIAYCISFFLLLFFKIIPLEVGLMFLSLFLIILSGHAFSEMANYFQKTKFAWLNIPVFVLIICFFLVTSFMQGITTGFSHVKDSPSTGDIAALAWLKENALENKTVLALLEEGFLVEYASGLRTVGDENYLLVPDADVRYDDINQLFASRLETGALHILGKYGVDYIFLSERYFARWPVPVFLENEECFRLVHDKEQKIYEVRCRLS